MRAIILQLTAINNYSMFYFNLYQLAISHDDESKILTKLKIIQ